METLATIDMTAIAGNMNDDIAAAIVIGLGIFAVHYGVKLAKYAFMKAAYDGPVTGFYDGDDVLHTRDEFESDEEFESAMESAMSDYGGNEDEVSEAFDLDDDPWDGTMLEDEAIDFDDPDVIAFEEACQASAARMSPPDEYTYDDYLEEREG